MNLLINKLSLNSKMGPVGLVIDILRVWNRLCKIKHGSSPRYDNSQIDSTSFVHALVYVSLFYKESNHQNFQFYLWNIGWFSQSGFSLFLIQMNEYDALIQEIYMPLGTCPSAEEMRHIFIRSGVISSESNN